MATSTLAEPISAPKKPVCSVITPIPPRTIPTPFGIEIKSITDLSKGVPNDCALVHSLMLQLTPMLAGFTCILKILNFVASVKKAISGPGGIVSGAVDIGKAIDKMSDCLGLIDPKPWLEMIKAILQMILAYVGCLIQAFESIRNMKVGIDLNAEGGTPVLLDVLDCASQNADAAQQALMSSMEPITPLLQLIDLIASIVGISISLPSLNLTSSADDPMQPIIQFHDTLQQVVDSLP